MPYLPGVSKARENFSDELQILRTIYITQNVTSLTQTTSWPGYNKTPYQLCLKISNWNETKYTMDPGINHLLEADEDNTIGTKNSLIRTEHIHQSNNWQV